MCAMTQPGTERSRGRYLKQTPRWSGHASLVTKISPCHCVRLPTLASPSLTHHHGPLAKIHPPVSKSCALVSTFIHSSAYVAVGRTYGRNGAGRCKDAHRSSHDSPTISLDQGTCNHRSEKRGSGHGAIEEGECLGVSSAGAEGARIGSFFFFDNGG